MQPVEVAPPRESKLAATTESPCCDTGPSVMTGAECCPLVVKCDSTGGRTDAADVPKSSKLLLPAEAMLDNCSLPYCADPAELKDESLYVEAGAAAVQHTTCRRVRFASAATIVYEITPCAEIYGVHPREFVFEKDYSMSPSAGFTDIETAWKRYRGDVDEEDKESASDESDASGWDEVFEIST